MTFHRPFARRAAATLALACAAASLSTPSLAFVGKITNPDLYGGWTATLSGMTGCGPTAMHVVIDMNSSGVGAATLTMHGQCGDSVVTGQTFRILTLDSGTGAGTANLTCGTGCGWNLRIQVAPDRQVMNLVDVDPINPGNYIAGVAVHR